MVEIEKQKKAGKKVAIMMSVIKIHYSVPGCSGRIDSTRVLVPSKTLSSV